MKGYAALVQLMKQSGKSNSSDAVETLFSTPEFSVWREAVRETEIEENDEPLVELPENEFFRFSPHAYVLAGAPYEAASPFSLRQGVVDRLREAQSILGFRAPGYRFKIFDGFRPGAVQKYMVDYHIRLLAEEDGEDVAALSEQAANKYLEKVLQIFAAPSTDPKRPTPHSTGGAVDLTIVDSFGVPIPMGSEIDSMPPAALPSFFKSSASPQFHENRELLRSCLLQVGFHRLPQEWWHFSYGDQCWAVLDALQNESDGRPSLPRACYAACTSD